jgi:hypothetical protein
LRDEDEDPIERHEMSEQRQRSREGESEIREAAIEMKVRS